LEEGMGDEQQGEGNPLGGGAVPIQISQEEAEAISRVCIFKKKKIKRLFFFYYYYY